MRILMVHGGVETSSAAEYRDSLTEAALRGCRADAGSPLAAAEAAVNTLENNPLFNAGYGSVLNLAGEVEMDAAIMDGQSGAFGGVGAIQKVANPVSVARKVLEETAHVLLVGAGAAAFARSQGFPEADCVSETMRRSWLAATAQREPERQRISLMTGLPLSVHAGDTVGCLVCDDGHLAAASSTGGSFLKLPGRVGDTPIVGGGILASELGAVVCTGIGEAFIETMTAGYVQSLLREGHSPQAAAEQAIQRLSQKKSLPGGVIVLDRHGNYGAAHNSHSFPVAVVVDGRVVADFAPAKLRMG